MVDLPVCGVLRRRGIRHLGRHLSYGLVAAAVVVTMSHERTAAADPSADRFDAHLAAGEYSLALEIARSTEPSQQDERLAQMARSQRRNGARPSSLYTLAAIRDDRVRANALREPIDGAEGPGGGVEPDFESLIELIEGTIAPDTWVDLGGPGAIDEFFNGVFVDPQGVLGSIELEKTPTRLARLRSPLPTSPLKGDVRHPSELRRVSLTRLEKAVQLRLAAGQLPTDAMRVLAGLQRIEYVFVYPETGDLVVAGPAGDWRVGDDGRSLSVDTGRPVLLLDDLVVILRTIGETPGRHFGCSINPVEASMARTKAFLDQSTRKPLKPGQRGRWLRQLRDQLGRQDIEYFGIDPHSHVARVLVEADYHMKLVGMGLADGGPDVPSYLDMIRVPLGESPPPMSVLRWWFTLNYQSVLASVDHDAFELRGQGVRVMSENQLLTAQGRRIPTGQSDELNQEFAHNFTTHFPSLCAKYPVYAELRNVFDMALVAALIVSDDLDHRVGWHRTCFGAGGAYVSRTAPAARQVETVINHRVVNRVHILAGISGGVSINPWRVVGKDKIETVSPGQLDAHRGPLPADAPRGPWWWD